MSSTATELPFNLIGGGPYPRPGEVSLAHHGVLFLDEMPEFKKPVIEALRQPLEDHQVTISRASGTLSYPARFMVIAAMNPCPCGYLSDPQRSCSCLAPVIQRYRARISGAVLDRMDLHAEVPPVRYCDLAGRQPAAPSPSIRRRFRPFLQRRYEASRCAQAPAGARRCRAAPGSGDQ